MLGPGEEQELLAAFNDHALAPSEPCHDEQTFHGLLEHWAAATPDAPAAVFEAPPHNSHAAFHSCSYFDHAALYIMRQRRQVVSCDLCRVPS